jgi:predicted transposase YdaD
VEAKPDYDQSLKRLLARAHDGFLTLVAPDLTWRSELSPEVPAVARQADLVWEVEHRDGSRGVLHVELQTRVAADIGERLAEYAIRLWRRDHLPIRSLVVYLRPAERMPASSFVMAWAGHESLRYTFDVLRLWEVPQERVLNTSFYELWPLAGLMADVSVESTLAVAERIARAPLPRDERDELERSLALFAGMRLPQQSLVDAIRRAHMALNLWEESSLKDALGQLMLEREREEGMAEGKAEGEASGMRNSLRLVLEARFGQLDDALTAAIQQADAAALPDLLVRAAKDDLPAIRAALVQP